MCFPGSTGSRKWEQRNQEQRTQRRRQVLPPELEQKREWRAANPVDPGCGCIRTTPALHVWDPKTSCLWTNKSLLLLPSSMRSYPVPEYWLQTLQRQVCLQIFRLHRHRPDLVVLLLRCYGATLKYRTTPLGFRTLVSPHSLHVGTTLLCCDIGHPLLWTYTLPFPFLSFLSRNFETSDF